MSEGVGVEELEERLRALDEEYRERLQEYNELTARLEKLRKVLNALEGGPYRLLTDLERLTIPVDGETKECIRSGDTVWTKEQLGEEIYREILKGMEEGKNPGLLLSKEGIPVGVVEGNGRVLKKAVVRNVGSEVDGRRKVFLELEDRQTVISKVYDSEKDLDLRLLKEGQVVGISPVDYSIKEVVREPLSTFRVERTGDLDFASVGGLEDVKEELRRCVLNLFRREDLAERFDVKPPNILFVGPPGCGKTLLAKALVNEVSKYRDGVEFLYFAGGQAKKGVVGESAELLTSLFEEAKRLAGEGKVCVIFIDEFEAIGARREEEGSVGREAFSVLSRYLEEAKEEKNVIVIGATNYPSLVDIALQRAGRFEKVIEVPPPETKRVRRKILEIHLRKTGRELREILDDDVNLDEVARRCRGWTGADLERLVKEAARYAIERGRGKISREDFEDALGKVLRETVFDRWIRSELLEKGYSFPPPESVEWEEVVGYDDIVKTLKDYVRVLEEVAELRDEGREVDRVKAGWLKGGILLYGEEGVGKRLLAKALLTEYERRGIGRVFRINVSDIKHPYVGESERRLRTVFETVKRLPAILYIEDLETFLPKHPPAGDPVADSLKKLFLQLMDEAMGTNSYLVATTREIDSVDPSALQRLQTVYVGLPDDATKKEMFRYFADRVGVKLGSDVNLDELVKHVRTRSDIESLYQRVFFLCKERGKDVAGHDDFLDALGVKREGAGRPESKVMYL